MTTLRIITFNLLSQDCVNNEWFPKIHNKYLKFENRKNRTITLLKSWISRKYIICFQEVNNQWNEELRHFFICNDYDYISKLYKNEKMGIAIAYPYTKYYCITYNHIICSDNIRDKYNRLKENNIEKNLLNELEEASKSENVSLHILLRDKTCNKYNFLVSTYHMPCKYKYKYFMLSHILSLKNSIYKLNNKWKKYGLIKNILCGDFNITYRKTEYLCLLGNNNLEDKYLNELKIAYDSIDKQPKKQIRFKSSYYDIHKREPLYTNVSLKDDIFMETLDYIFIENDFEVISSIVGLTIDNPEQYGYPNWLCPSDHLPLSVSLKIE
jgi:hypothetical protein